MLSYIPDTIFDTQPVFIPPMPPMPPIPEPKIYAMLLVGLGLVCFILKSSVGWCLECVIVSFWQGAMRRNNELLQRIATQQK